MSKEEIENCPESIQLLIANQVSEITSLRQRVSILEETIEDLRVNYDTHDKGFEGEKHVKLLLENIINENYPIISTRQHSSYMDLHIRITPKLVITVEVKNHKSPIDRSEVTKFFDDIRLLHTKDEITFIGSIFVSLTSSISNYTSQITLTNCPITNTPIIFLSNLLNNVQYTSILADAVRQLLHSCKYLDADQILKTDVSEKVPFLKTLSQSGRWKVPEEFKSLFNTDTNWGSGVRTIGKIICNICMVNENTHVRRINLIEAIRSQMESPIAEKNIRDHLIVLFKKQAFETRQTDKRRVIIHGLELKSA